MHVSVQADLRRNREWLIKSVMIHWISKPLTRIPLVILELIRAHDISDRKGGGLLLDADRRRVSARPTLSADSG